MMESMGVIRDCNPVDFPQLLRLNLESEHFLSPMSLPQLETLHRQAWYSRAVCREERVLGFLLVLADGAVYDSVNYLWFANRYRHFLYIDRVVVDATARGQSLARRLYEDLFALARNSGIERITCEFDTNPPNEASRRFHESFGFREVGSQKTVSGKSVSLQERVLL
jgi:uncharacterized protein